MRDYKKYDIWKKSHKMALDVYAVTKRFPKDERFGMISQLRRASLSVPTNIVEGTGRSSQKEFAYFINISSASAAEVEYLLKFSFDINYIAEEQYNSLTTEVISIRKMLNSFHQKLKQNGR